MHNSLEVNEYLAKATPPPFYVQGLSVDHALPTPRKALPDARSFSAWTIGIASGGVQPIEVVSHGGGRYSATVHAYTYTIYTYTHIYYICYICKYG